MSPIWSDNTTESLNRGMRRRTDVVGVFPNQDATVGLIGTTWLNTPTNGLKGAAPRQLLVTSSRIGCLCCQMTVSSSRVWTQRREGR